MFPRPRQNPRVSGVVGERVAWVSTHRGAGRSSEVERSLVVRWVVGSILHGCGPIELFLVPVSAP